MQRIACCINAGLEYFDVAQLGSFVQNRSGENVP